MSGGAVGRVEISRNDRYAAGDWVVHGLGWREFHILELNGLPRQMVLDRLLHADVIYVEGGRHYHLARSITGNDAVSNRSQSRSADARKRRGLGSSCRAQ